MYLPHMTEGVDTYRQSMNQEITADDLTRRIKLSVLLSVLWL